MNTPSHIAELMSQRQRLSEALEQQDAVCERDRDRASEALFEHLMDRKLDTSELILRTEATCLADLRAQISILARRAADGLGVADDLLHLAGPKAN
ncbi:MAG: hypothetical protein ACLPTZ_15635 [Beijerinckiaceae bacterium]